MRDELVRNFYATVEKYPTLHLFTINTDQDHVHIQIEIAPNTSVAAAVSVLKSHSSIELKKKYKFIRDMYIDGGIWSVGYFSSTIGLNETIIKKYIENQGKEEIPHQPNFRFS